MPSTIIYLTQLSELQDVIGRLREKLFAKDVPMETFLDIQLAVTEAIGNAFLHGTKDLENPLVKVEWKINTNSIFLKIKDNGSGFDFQSAGIIDENNLLDEKGRGLFFISNLLDEVNFNEKGNEICCLKRWGKQDFTQ